MAIEVRTALRAFIVTKLKEATQKQFDDANAGYPLIPDLSDPDRKALTILNLRYVPTHPQYTRGYVFLPDPRNGGEDYAIHGEYTRLRPLADQEKQEEDNPPSDG